MVFSSKTLLSLDSPTQTASRANNGHFTPDYVPLLQLGPMPGCQHLDYYHVMLGKWVNDGSTTYYPAFPQSCVGRRGAWQEVDWQEREGGVGGQSSECGARVSQHLPPYVAYSPGEGRKGGREGDCMTAHELRTYPVGGREG